MGQSPLSASPILRKLINVLYFIYSIRLWRDSYELVGFNSLQTVYDMAMLMIRPFWAILGLVMHWLCRNLPQLCMTQPQCHSKLFQLLKSSPKYLSNSVWHDNLHDKSILGISGPNYALIMQNFALIMHESVSISPKNIHNTKTSSKIPFQRYITWLCSQNVHFGLF